MPKTLCASTVVYATHVLSFQVCGILMGARQRCLGDQSPMRTLVAWCTSMEALVGLSEQIHVMCVPGGRVTPPRRTCKEAPGNP